MKLIEKKFGKQEEGPVSVICFLILVGREVQYLNELDFCWQRMSKHVFLTAGGPNVRRLYKV